MESNPDSAALAQQVQALVATIEVLTKQNQEMKLRLQQVQQAQQEENRSKDNLRKKGIVNGEEPLTDQLLPTSKTRTSFEK